MSKLLHEWRWRRFLLFQLTRASDRRLTTSLHSAMRAWLQLHTLILTSSSLPRLADAFFRSKAATAMLRTMGEEAARRSMTEEGRLTGRRTLRRRALRRWFDDCLRYDGALLVLGKEGGRRALKAAGLRQWRRAARRRLADARVSEVGVRHHLTVRRLATLRRSLTCWPRVSLAAFTSLSLRRCTAALRSAWTRWPVERAKARRVGSRRALSAAFATMSAAKWHGSAASLLVAAGAKLGRLVATATGVRRWKRSAELFAAGAALHSAAMQASLPHPFLPPPSLPPP